MKHIVIADGECVARSAPIARKYSVGLEATTFYDVNYLMEHPDGIQDYLLHTNGIGFMTMHGPFTGLSTGVRDPSIRAITMLRYLQACDTAEALGIEDIVIHNNFYDYCAPVDVWRNNSIAFFAQLAEKIQGRPVRFHLENTLEKNGDLMLELILATNSPQLDLCLDVGHAQGMVPNGMPPLEWIYRYGKHIGHVHLHNNNGLRDEHKNLDDGVLPMEEILAALEERAPDAIWCIECGFPYQDVRRSLDYLIRLGYLPPLKGDE